MARVTQQHVDARREAILEAAAGLFARKGISSATMAEIAAEADLSAGAIYRYFSSKDELLRAVFDEAVDRNQQLFRAEAESAPTPFAALERIGRRIWIEQDDRDDLICEVQMALAAAREPDDFGLDLSRNRQAIRDLLEEMVRASQDSGEIDPNINPSTLALLLQAATGGIQKLKLEDGENIDVEAAFDLLVRMVTGLGTNPTLSNER
jgi:TetR/AcrR family transcriptional regulator, transcriptional repressor of aconitase